MSCPRQPVSCWILSSRPQSPKRVRNATAPGSASRSSNHLLRVNLSHSCVASTTYSYLDSANDFRLATITNYKTRTTVLSKFDYTYNELGLITGWKQQTDSNTPTLFTFGYDAANQLTRAVLTNTSTQAVLAQYAYGYDLAANRTSEQIGLGVTATAFNSANQITGRTGGGLLQLAGYLNKPGTVKIGGVTTPVDGDNRFSGTATVATGPNSIPVVATNLNGNATTNTYNVTIPTSTAVTPTYEPGTGNMLNSGSDQTYTWDAKNQLKTVTITSSGAHSIFTYDGQGRRVKSVEWPHASETGTHVTRQFVWRGNTMIQERNESNAIARRFFAQGEVFSGNKYFYTRDHLGSVRELSDNSGATLTRYDYDPFGRVTPTYIVTTPKTESDFKYAGYYWHDQSGLNLTKYRAYDANMARWLSRDPIAEAGGINLYGYVGNDPVDTVDPLGLWYEVNYNDGRPNFYRSNPTRDDVIASFKNAAPGSVKSFSMLGHGDGRHATFNMSEEAAHLQTPHLELNGKNEIILVGANGADPISFTDLVKGKFAPRGAKVFFFDCNTGTGDDNIAKHMSEAAPLATVIAPNACFETCFGFPRRSQGGYSVYERGKLLPPVD